MTSLTVNYHIRPAMRADEPFLWQMLYYAAHVFEEPGVSLEDVRRNPDLTKYVRDWGLEGDLGYLAVDTDSGQSLGAVWVRRFDQQTHTFLQTDVHTPELAIAVLPDYLGQGIGSQLMQALLAGAKGRYPAVGLSVRANNPAVRLYQRLGFVTVREIVNRVGGLSYEMIYRF